MHKYIGKSMHRKEDYRLLTGTGMFVGDISLTNMAEAVFVRSPHAHAKIVDINIEAAKALKGVYGIFTAKDIEDLKPLTQFESHCFLPPNLVEAISPTINFNYEDILAKKKVTYVGQSVAIVVAKNRYIAEDAADLVEVTYEPLQPLVDPYEARKEDAILIQEHLENNIQSHFHVTTGNVEQAFAEADYIMNEKIRTPRLGSNPLETRGVVAKFDTRNQELRVWSSSQMPYEIRSTLAHCLSLPDLSIRVTAPDVGGGFGPKGGVHPEEIVIPYLAKKLQRPIKWVEDRMEHLTSARQSRDQIHDVKVSFKQDGTITAIKDFFVIDSGAVNFFALTCAYNSAYHLRGAYKIPNYDSECEVILTNKTPNVPFRGAGRPEVVFVMDRIIDIVARKLKVDPIEIMKKNMIQAEDMPYDQGILVKDGHQLIYDSGDYPDALRKAVDLVDYDAFRKEQEEKKKEGKLVGIGISSYVEGTGAGPYEGAHISIDPSGHVTAYLGCTPQGQGHETVFSQIAADGLGVNPQNITVRVGETTVLPMGQGTYASRSAVNAGSAIYEAALKMREKVLKIAAHLLKTDEDLVIDEGKIYAETSPEKFVTYQDVGRAALPAKLGNLPAGMEASLEVTHYFSPPTVTFAASIHMAQVEVDKETGFVDLQKYSVVHDCGTVINPMIVDGQVQGGIAQGIGSALYEEIVYDQTGQLLTGTYMDYLLPTSMEVPTVAKAHQEFKSTRNRLGIKGVGEGGAIAPPAAIANAIVDALHPLEIKTNDLPISPNKLRTWIKEAEASFQALQTN
ncbi:xanthine dehydrogenase family protein molybdopterin-binding subunit [Cytobacillus sp. FSL W7-1323]|uniref:xanthine dehydrogenase family protein molybdopterin-binding subunit n=1 Tax=Cytobacillus sp. FSL W7-1323 TaxID=2921700 RepID=UPI003158EDBA